MARGDRNKSLSKKIYFIQTSWCCLGPYTKCPTQTFNEYNDEGEAKMIIFELNQDGNYIKLNG